MEKYKITRYEHDTNDFRSEVEAMDTVYIAYILMGGSGLSIQILHVGESWREGADELLGVFETREEAKLAIHRYMDSM